MSTSTARNVARKAVAVHWAKKKATEAPVGTDAAVEPWLTPSSARA